MTREKLCRKCNRLLPLDAFPADGFSPCCECRAFQRATWFIRNKKQIQAARSEYMKAWRKRNPGYRGRKQKQTVSRDKMRQYKQTYRSKPGVKEHEQAVNHEYYLAHRDEILAQKKLKKLRKVEL